MSSPEVKDGKRWTATRKGEIVLALLRGADLSEVCRKNGISQSQAYAWRDSFLEGGQESLKSRRGRKDPKEREVSRLERKVGQLTLQLEILEEVARLKKNEAVALSGRFLGRGYSRKVVALALGLHRSTLYRFRDRGVSSSVKEPVIDEELAFRIRGILDQEEAFGHRRVWAHLRFKEGECVNVKKVHRIMKLKGWQCKLWNRPGRKGPQVAQKRSVVDSPDSLWSSDLTKIYCGKDGWCPLIAVVDNGSREAPGYRFSRKGRALEATDALDRAVISRYTSKEAVPQGLTLRSDNGSIFLARAYLASTEYWGIRQEYIPSGKPDWNGVVERFFRTLKQECVWLHKFESFEQAEKIISQWIDNYNKNRLHSSLGYKTPKEWRKQFYLLPQVA